MLTLKSITSSGVGNPLTTGHELVFDRVAEGIAHAAVETCQADALARTAAERLAHSSFSILDIV